VRQRPPALRSKVVTTKNIIRHKCGEIAAKSWLLDGAGQTPTLQRTLSSKVSEFQGIRSAKTEIRFWRTDRNRPSRGYPGWSHPQFRVSLCIFAGGVDATSHSISAGRCDHAWDGGDHPR
jgi:hypothetical protein